MSWFIVSVWWSVGHKKSHYSSQLCGKYAKPQIARMRSSFVSQIEQKILPNRNENAKHVNQKD